jgi:hypothetical protein
VKKRRKRTCLCNQCGTRIEAPTHLYRAGWICDGCAAEIQRIRLEKIRIKEGTQQQRSRRAISPYVITPHTRRHRGRRVKIYPALRVMLNQLEAAEPGRRHINFDDVGKVIGVLRQPSTFPPWIDELGVRRTRKVVDRLIRIIKIGLLENEVSYWPPSQLDRDKDLWFQIRELAARRFEKFCPPPYLLW